MAVKYTRPRGTQDVLPGQSGRWLRLEKLMRRTVGLYGYKEIRLPTFEATEVFARGVGDTTDIVSKEMYTFLDKGNRSITLRPEGTAGVARAILENGLLGSSPAPLKAYYLQSCFRYEKAQKGRLREFHQLGIECYGADDPAADAEVIAVARQILSAAGLRQVRLEINSIGCPHCRPKYHEALREYFSAHKAELCETCLERLDRNPMRILDCKVESCGKVAAGAPVVLDYLCEDCQSRFDQVKALLDAQGIEYVVNPTIVRGLDYYTNTVFEFIHTAVGTQGTICGGGRYNGLMEQFGGPATPAVGFGMGVERLLMALEDEGVELGGDPVPALYLAPLGEAGKTEAIRLATELRSRGLYVETDIVGRGLKAQMKYANKLGAVYSMVLGDDEVNARRARVKRMEDGAETELSLDDLGEFLCQNL
ncbi:histidine--tRNA ligase [Gemmiger sp. An120]|uniref:histidine--tRNA ligase n=1 Tax=Gemmiger sp. An120 TaxID=1965549 RepID=UPI000B364D23|nr:histidine--tRNA ligase [Gemmiger sp. An120]OUQ42021.1 histidine--tRNA ligase [Gemmiger sp. An120]